MRELIDGPRARAKTRTATRPARRRSLMSSANPFRRSH